MDLFVRASNTPAIRMYEKVMLFPSFMVAGILFYYMSMHHFNSSQSEVLLIFGYLPVKLIVFY